MGKTSAETGHYTMKCELLSVHVCHTNSGCVTSDRVCVETVICAVTVLTTSTCGFKNKFDLSDL